jgi:hypothetical protein
LSSQDISNFATTNIFTFSQFYNYLEQLTSGNSQQAIQIYLNYVENPYIGIHPSSLTNTLGCKLVVYKPNNYQFANQGGVSSSLQIFKRGLDTIKTNINNQNSLSGKNTTINTSGKVFTPFIYKQKSQPCQKALPTFFRQVSYNPKTCFNLSKTTDDQNIDYGNFVVKSSVANNGISASNPV